MVKIKGPIKFAGGKLPETILEKISRGEIKPKLPFDAKLSPANKSNAEKATTRRRKK